MVVVIFGLHGVKEGAWQTASCGDPRQGALNLGDHEIHNAPAML